MGDFQTVKLAYPGCDMMQGTKTQGQIELFPRAHPTSSIMCCLLKDQILNGPVNRIRNPDLAISQNGNDSAHASPFAFGQEVALIVVRRRESGQNAGRIFRLGQRLGVIESLQKRLPAIRSHYVVALGETASGCARTALKQFRNPPGIFKRKTN
jgi:hypothetical protein